MLESYPSFFVVVCGFLSSAKRLKSEMPDDTKLEFMSAAKQGFVMFLREESNGHILPRSTEKAMAMNKVIEDWMQRFVAGNPPEFIEPIAKGVEGFLISLQDELDRIPVFTVTPKGNLDIRRLAKAISKGFPKATWNC